jgi:DNA replication protein DnaC
VAPARGNEKGRVERAIRFIRDRFFAARQFRDLDDLNAQALQWTCGEAADRPCPEDRSRSVRACFIEEQPRLLALPLDLFPTEERVALSAGKAPYLRFDLNDYSIPHTHVGRTLELVATLSTVRIFDGATLIAEHARSFDKGQQIEDPQHIEALVEESARHASIVRSTACIMPPPAAPPSSSSPPNMACIWACSPEGCCRSSTPMAQLRWSAPWLQHSRKNRRISRPSATSSTCTSARAVRPRPSQYGCRMTRVFETSPCGPMICATTKAHGRRQVMSTIASLLPNETVMTLERLRERLSRLSLHGLGRAETVMNEPWLNNLLDLEEAERDRRSLKRRLDDAKLRTFKPMTDFDWSWPTRCDRALIEELFSLHFIEECANVVLIGPNGLGKTMITKNLVHQAVLRGHTARFTRAGDMLADLAKQDSSSALTRRLRRYVAPDVLAIDEVGYLSYDTRYADLFFEVVTRRYQECPIILSTNKPFGQWSEVFPTPPAS